MSIQLIEESDGKILVVHVSGKLVTADYTDFVSEFERLVRRTQLPRPVRHDRFPRLGSRRAVGGQVRIKHFADIERLAMVGEKKWQRGMATFCKPFTKAAID